MTDATITQTSPNSITVTDGGTNTITVNQPPTQSVSISSPTTQTVVVETGARGPAGAAGAQGNQGPAGPGLITGGTAGQFPVKVDGTDYNLQWSGNVIVNPTSGSIAVSSGASGGMSFGNTKLYQSASGVIRTDTNFYVGAALTVGGSQTIGGTLAVAGVNSSNTISITSGSGGFIARSQSAITNTVFASKINADTVDRFIITADGTHTWGIGGTTAVDTNLYRAGVGVLKSDGAIQFAGGNTSALFTAQASIRATGSAATDISYRTRFSTNAIDSLVIQSDGKHLWSDGTNAADTNLYRTVSGTLKTDGSMLITSRLGVGVTPVVPFEVRATASPQAIIGGLNQSGSTVSQLKIGGHNANVGVVASVVEVYDYTDNIEAASPTNYSRLEFGFNNFGTPAVYDAVVGTNAGGLGTLRKLIFKAGNNIGLAVETSGKLTIGTGSDTNLYRSAAGILQTDGKLMVNGILVGPTQLWNGIENGYSTLPRAGLGDSKDYTQTPSSGTMAVTHFRAEKSITVSTIRFTTGGAASSGGTLARVGLYSVDTSTGNLTLISSAPSTTAFSGTYASQSFTLSAPQALVAGTRYAVGIIQVGTTSASIFGTWLKVMYQGGTPVFYQTKSGLTDLPASVTTGLGTGEFPMYFELI